jgi:hypothetical protein
VLHAVLVYGLLLAATVALELLVVRGVAPAPSRRRAATVCIAANLFTHPLATLLLWHWYADLLVIEALVTTLEFGCYVRLVPMAPARAFALALLANLLTAFAGLLWWALQS